MPHRIFSQCFRCKWIGSNEHIFDEVSNMEEIKANKTETYHENESFKKLIINLLRKTIVSVKQEQDPFLKEYSEKNSWKLIYTYGKLKKKV